jgi:hypothetical protein
MSDDASEVRIPVAEKRAGVERLVHKCCALVEALRVHRQRHLQAAEIPCRAATDASVREVGGAAQRHARSLHP